jgi:hypothetical protein
VIFSQWVDEDGVRQCLALEKTQLAELVSLLWHKSKNGYRTERRSNAVAGYGGSIINPLLALEIELEGPAEETFVIARSRKTEPVLLVAGQSTVLFDLANAARTEEAVLTFAKEWGLLTRAPKDKFPELDVASFYRVRDELWCYLHMLSTGRWSEACERLKGASVPAGVRRFASDGISTYIEPRSLQEFCFQDLMLLVEQRVPVRRCPAPKCNGFYAERRGRRACSNRCRKAKDRQRSAHAKAEGGEREHARMDEIQNMWRDRSDVFIDPSMQRAFVSYSEMPKDATERDEFLRSIAESIAGRPEGSNSDDALP